MGSLSENTPRSHSAIAATAVIGLVMLAMRKIDPSSTALSVPSIAAPWLGCWAKSYMDISTSL